MALFSDYLVLHETKHLQNLDFDKLKSITVMRKGTLCNSWPQVPNKYGIAFPLMQELYDLLIAADCCKIVLYNCVLS